MVTKYNLKSLEISIYVTFTHTAEMSQLVELLKVKK